jgi:transcriptional regulator with XRE-family HTH domain
MKTRLQQFLQLEQLSPARLADLLGIQRSGLSHILSGRNKPGFDFIQKLLTRFPTLNAEWLITGKGKMYKEYPEESSKRDSRQRISPVEIDFENKQENEVSDDSSLASDYEEYNLNEGFSEPSENSIKSALQGNGQKNRALRKILLIYSDNTFTEIIPAKIGL